MSQPQQQGDNKWEERLICPITRELPFDPVMAEDGRIYERDAIQKHFDEAKSPIRSPMTNEPIGRRLLASPQIKELIETLIQSGAIVGDLQKAWEEKVVEKKNAEDLLNRALLKRAEGGDAMAMYKVSIEYREGEDGFEKNGEKSYKWIVKAHAAKLPAATASLSVNLINGRRGDYEITQDKSRGLLLLGIAAAQGSDYAALQMGLAFAHGQYDVHRNTDEAIYWLTRGLGNDIVHGTTSEHFREKCKKTLDELTQM